MAEQDSAAAGLEISVVVTLFNEASSLEELHRRTLAALEEMRRPFELLYVDDGSSDGTFALVTSLRGGDPRVRAVRLKIGRAHV